MHYVDVTKRTRAISAAFTTLLALLALCLACVPATAYADVKKDDIVSGSTVEDRGLSVAECPSIEAEFAALATQDGTIYFSRAGDEEAQIASITKVMTAMVALDTVDDSIRIAVSAEAAEIGESSAELKEGDILTLDAALKALLVPSGNDAAIAIADAVGAKLMEEDPSLGDDAQSAFVAKMNDKANELGLEDTLYENAHGLDDDQFEGDLHSTAFDQIKVAQAAMKYPEIREIVGNGNTTIQVQRNGETADVELETTDLLIDSYAYAIGIKTGMTGHAGNSFMGAASKDGQELYALVLNSADEYTRFDDAKTLFEWGYDHIVDVPLANTAEYTTMRADGDSSQVPVVAKVSHTEWIDRTVKATMEDPEASVRIFDLEGNVSQSVELDNVAGTVNPGDKVGKISFIQQNRVIAEQDLIATERVEAPNPIDTLAIWWQRTTQGLNDETGKAPSEVLNVMPVVNNRTTNAA